MSDDESSSVDTVPQSVRAYQSGYLKFVMVIAILCLALAIIFHEQWDGNAVLYVGLPFLLSLLVAVILKPETIIGESLKVLTLLIILSMIVFREGVICVVMAAPVLYLFTFVIGLVIQTFVNRKKAKQRLLMSPLALVFALMSIEGSTPVLTFERANTITAVQVINADVESIKAALAKPAAFAAERPMLTAIFPAPVKSYGGGLTPGNTRTVDFVYYKHVFFNPHKGSTTFQVSQVDDNSVVFTVPRDTSYIANYLKWHFAKVQWQAVGKGKTQVKWTLSWDRELDPAWYFGPMQDFYVHKTAEFMLANLAEQVE